MENIKKNNFSNGLPSFIVQKITAFTPQYRDLTFKTANQFSNWLKKTTKTEIILKDSGQDLVKLHVDEFGEILHTEVATLGKIYNGSLLLDDPELLLPGDNIRVWVLMFRDVSTFKYQVEKIIRH